MTNFKKRFTSPVGMALSPGRELCAVVGIEVAAVSGSERPANVVTRWTAQCRRSLRITLTLSRSTTSVCQIIRTVECVVVATVNCTG